MKKQLLLVTLLCMGNLMAHADNWPDGTKMDKWFENTSKVDPSTLGKQYVITDYGVKQDSTVVQTEAIQAVIDKAAQEGGGLIVVPKGTYLSGSLFFKKGTRLMVDEGGKLKGSDRIANFAIVETRIEGETCPYFAALVNADHNDGFVICGKGTIDGNGYHYWNEFWIRRKWNPKCTNKDAQRPRLVYISNSSNVTVQDVRLQNSPFWTNHIYNSDHVRYLDCYIYAVTDGPVKGPSTDAIDIDKCHDFLVDGCYMNVTDDAVVLKGGKGTWADTMSVNGPVERVLIQNCHYGDVAGLLTLGSESLHDRNIILRNCKADKSHRVLWLKMRTDTPQHYEYVSVENITGNTGKFITVRPWSQFYKPGERKLPLSKCNNISFKNIKMTCKNFFDVGLSDKYQLNDFSFVNIDVTDDTNAFDPNLIENTVVKNVVINGKKVK